MTAEERFKQGFRDGREAALLNPQAQKLSFSLILMLVFTLLVFIFNSGLVLYPLMGVIVIGVLLFYELKKTVDKGDG